VRYKGIKRNEGERGEGGTGERSNKLLAYVMKITD
jgi:hypothetical protein